MKRTYYKYKARCLVLDANGPGLPIVDMLTKPTYIAETGEVLADFGLINDEDKSYKKYQTKDCELNAVYVIKANAAFNTEMYVNLQNFINSGKLKFLIDDRIAKQKLLGFKKGQEMTSEERAEYLKPYVLTSILKEQLIKNLSTQ